MESAKTVFFFQFSLNTTPNMKWDICAKLYTGAVLAAWYFGRNITNTFSITAMQKHHFIWFSPGEVVLQILQCIPSRVRSDDNDLRSFYHRISRSLTHSLCIVGVITAMWFCLCWTLSNVASNQQEEIHTFAVLHALVCQRAEISDMFSVSFLAIIL